MRSKHIRHGNLFFTKQQILESAAGEISYQLLRYDNDANNIVHFSVWSSLENARRFFESAELEEIRKKAGVKNSHIYLPTRNRTWCVIAIIAITLCTVFK